MPDARAPINRILTTTGGATRPCNDEGLLKRARASNRACRVRLSVCKNALLHFPKRNTGAPHIHALQF